MALITGYYNSLNGDRKYNAETMSKYFSGLFTRGVLQNYKDKFVVKSDKGMKVKVPTGKAFFTDGKWIENTADITLTLDPSDVVLNRIDVIVLRNDKNEGVRNATVLLKKGTPSSSPVAPALENDSYVEEMCLCEIRVNKLTENITQANITNTIPNTEVCGYVTGLIDQVDTSDLYMQYETAYKEFYEKSNQDFNDWFQNLKENLSTSTLIRQYKNVTRTTIQDQKVIDIGIPQFNPVLDILDVYINGIYIQEGQQDGQGYTATETQITLNMPLDKGQDVYFVVFKSIDGEKATEVIEIVEDLQNDVRELQTDTEGLKRLNDFIYYATGVDDNKYLSQLAEDFYSARGQFEGIGTNAQMTIKVIGELGISSVSGGSGSSDYPFYWFILGKYNNKNSGVDTSKSTRKLTFDFSNAQRVSLASQTGHKTVSIGGNDVNIIGLQLVQGGEGSTLQWFDGLNVYCRDCMFYLNANGIAIGSSQGGTFEHCRVSATSVTAKAIGLNSNGLTPLKVIDTELIVYNGTSVTDESVAILGEANKTEGVVIVERCNLPLRDRGGYKQSQTVKINSGYYTLIGNTMGKAPALYSTEASKGANVGTMLVSK